MVNKLLRPSPITVIYRDGKLTLKPFHDDLEAAAVYLIVATEKGAIFHCSFTDKTSFNCDNVIEVQVEKTMNDYKRFNGGNFVGGHLRYDVRLTVQL
jgi:hypothetical protein